MENLDLFLPQLRTKIVIIPVARPQHISYRIYIAHSILYRAHSTLYSVTLHYTECTLYYTVHTLHYTVHTIHYTVILYTI